MTAPTLEGGVEYVADCLGVLPVPGGVHPRMGTHNALVRLGTSQYLEVIAIDPSAPRPSRPRWFELDRLFDQTPRLATWMILTSNLAGALARVSLPLGPAEEMSRGTLAWRVTMPADGRLVLDGSAPGVIQWSGSGHPSAMLPESGCALLDLTVQHKSIEQVEALLREVDFDGPVTLRTPEGEDGSRLCARIQTPHGVRVIDSERP